jgi:hypothetical protein
MAATDKEPNWLARNRNTLFLIACVVIGQVILYLTTTANSKREIERYKALQLASRVDKVLSASRGIQKVKLTTGETQPLVLVGIAQSYIQAGDSLVKAAGSETITVYRHYPTYTEVSVFGPGALEKPGAKKYTGLIRRYQIKKP